MKKILIIIGVISIFTSTSFAAGTGWLNSITNSDISFKPSKNVSIYYNVDTNKQNYTIGSKHKQGNRVFATTSASNTIYYLESDSYIGKTGSELTGVTMPSPGSTCGSGWHSI